LDKIDDSSERIVNLIKDVLNFSRPSIFQDNFVAVDLNTTLKEVIDDFEIIIREEDASIILGALLTVIGIPIQFHQLFSNLISNALKFNNGNPRINIATEDFPEDNCYKITIADNDWF
jgi:signal transduction histidine kinase